jgi:electron transfer flavoprotein alpha subunit
MSVLVYTESWEGKFRKSTYEAVCYASKTAKLLNTDVIAIALGGESDDELKTLGSYGVNKVLASNSIENSDNQAISKLIANYSSGASIIIFANTYTSKMIAPRLAIKIKAGIASNVINTPSSFDPIQTTRKSFSSKAIEKIKINTTQAIIILAQNSFGISENIHDCKIEKIQNNIEDNITVNGKEIGDNKVSLAEAEIIVSAGRGLKGPENWGMIEELASLLSAATACSKPVSDIGWRPHSEHVGQTGKAVAPNLYIAIGISGAIQHLAGVNSSKVMVVINTDPEAPFFKAADYGVVGDAFEVLPRLIEEIKKIK